VLAVALVLRLRAGPATTPLASGADPILRVALGALLVAAGGREVHAALRHVEALDLRAALGALYLAATAPIFFFAAGRRRDGLLAFEGLVALGIGIVLCAMHGRIPGRAWVSGVELTGLVAAVGSGVVLLRSAVPHVRAALGIAAVGNAFARLRHVNGGRLGAELSLLNPPSSRRARSPLVLLRAHAQPASAGSTSRWARRRGLAFGAGLAGARRRAGLLRPSQRPERVRWAFGRAAVPGFRRAHGGALARARGFAVTIGKVGLHDLASVETPWRILVTGCLGVVLLGSAYAYARRDRGAVDGPAGDDDDSPPGPTADPGTFASDTFVGRAPPPPAS
jgi:hypothetical protein